MSRLSVQNNVNGDLPYLDWLRFIAAILVVCAHVRGLQFLDFQSLDQESKTIFVAIFFSVTRLGYEAVVVFFVLSGYLVAGRILERLNNGDFDIKTYAIDRFSRIFIPIIPALLITYIVQALTSNVDNVFIFLANTVGLQGVIAPVLTFNGPLWSLAYEIWFYILGGSIAGALSLSRRYLLLIPIIVSLCIFLVLKYYLLFCWMIGGFTYIWASREKSRMAVFAAILLIVSGIIHNQLNSPGFVRSNWRIDLPEGMGSIILASGVALLITQLVLREPPSGRMSRYLYGWGTKLAGFSYTLYLIHYPVLIFIFEKNYRQDKVNPSNIILYILIVLFTIAISYLAFIPFEGKTNRVRILIKNMLR